MSSFQIKMCKFNPKNDSRRHKFPKGYTPWNKGLTKETDSRLIRSKKYIESVNGEGNSFYGKKHTNEAKKKISQNRDYKIGKENPSFGLHIWKNREHPRGMLGKENKWGKHTIEEKKKIKEARKTQIIPKVDTSIEIKIQKFLSLLHIEYITHKYISEITHAYQCDIFIPSKKIIIECDGCYWHGCLICNKNINEIQKEQIKKDKLRTKELQEKGFKVLRLREHEIKKLTLDGFYKKDKQGHYYIPEVIK